MNKMSTDKEKFETVNSGEQQVVSEAENNGSVIGEAEVSLAQDNFDDEDLLATSTVVLDDYDTGEEFTFYVAYEFPFEDEYYYVLVSVDEGNPQAVFARAVELPDGSEGFETLDDEEFERVADEYERLCELMDDEEELEDDGIELKE